jgi:hypothetical protein
LPKNVLILLPIKTIPFPAREDNETLSRLVGLLVGSVEGGKVRVGYRLGKIVGGLIKGDRIIGYLEGIDEGA